MPGGAEAFELCQILLRNSCGADPSWCGDSPLRSRVPGDGGQLRRWEPRVEDGALPQFCHFSVVEILHCGVAVMSEAAPVGFKIYIIRRLSVFV